MWRNSPFILMPIIISFTNADMFDGENKMLTRLTRAPYFGFIHLTDCRQTVKEVLAKPFLLNYRFAMTPFWHNWTENFRDPQLKNKYRWSYRMVELVNKRKEEKEINSDKFVVFETSAFLIPPYSVKPGLYRIYSTATLKDPKEKDKNLKKSRSLKCYLYVVGQPPVVIVSGGSYRIVPSLTEIKLNADQSFDLNKPTITNEDFKYRWSCSQVKKPPTFCARHLISIGSNFVIPSKFVEEGEKFNLVVKVTTPAGTEGEATQVIEVVKNAAQLHIQ